MYLLRLNYICLVQRAWLTNSSKCHGSLRCPANINVYQVLLVFKGLILDHSGVGHDVSTQKTESICLHSQSFSVTLSHCSNVIMWTLARCFDCSVISCLKSNLLTQIRNCSYPPIHLQIKYQEGAEMFFCSINQSLSRVRLWMQSNYPQLPVPLGSISTHGYSKSTSTQM